MVIRNELKIYTVDHVRREWGANVWEEPPSRVVVIPFPGGVLFGAAPRDTAQRVSFLLTSEDARIIGERLLNAATEADHGSA